MCGKNMPGTASVLMKIRSKFANGGFGRNVLIMFTGTALGQACSLLLSPVLTRIYSPELFGVQGFFIALIGISAVIASLRYEMALPLAGNKEDAANLMAVCFASLISLTVILYSLLALLPQEWLAYALGSLMPYRFLLPVGFMCVGAYQIMLGYATLEGVFAIVARTKIYQGIVGPVSQIALGLSGAGGWGLMIGYICGQSASIFNMLARLVIKPGDVLSKITCSGMVKMARRFARFPLISTWSAMINMLGTNSMLLIMIPAFYSTTIAGFVFLTDRIIGRPLLLISTSILQVYLGEAAKTQTADPKAMRRRFLQVTGGQFVIVAMWLLLINTTAFYFIPVVFGSEWAGAVIYIHILSICYLPQMTIVPVMHTLQIMEKQGLTAAWEFGRFILISGGFAASYILAFDAWEAILVYAISQAFAQLVLFVIMYLAIQRLQQLKEI